MPVSAFPRTFIDQLNRSLLSRRIASRRTCSLWRIDLSGLARVSPILQCRLCYNTCSLWPGRWVTRCGRWHAGWIAHANRLDLRERPSPLVRDTVHHSGQVVTFVGSSASAAVNSDILRLVARSQTRLFRTNRPVGTCSLIVNHTRTSLHCRETLFRPEPHPYRSECNTSGLHFIFTP